MNAECFLYETSNFKQQESDMGSKTKILISNFNCRW